MSSARHVHDVGQEVVPVIHHGVCAACARCAHEGHLRGVSAYTHTYLHPLLSVMCLMWFFSPLFSVPYTNTSRVHPSSARPLLASPSSAKSLPVGLLEAMDMHEATASRPLDEEGDRGGPRPKAYMGTNREGVMPEMSRARARGGAVSSSL